MPVPLYTNHAQDGAQWIINFVICRKFPHRHLMASFPGQLG